LKSKLKLCIQFIYIIGGVEMVRDIGKYQGCNFGCNFGRAVIELHAPKIYAYRTPAIR
jgi:hypothetical protein